MINFKICLVIGFLSISFFVLISGNFLAPLSNRLTADQIITIRGKTGDFENETSFNLQCGDCKWNDDIPDDNSCDIILHFVTRFISKEAIRTYYDNGWSATETWGGFPFETNTDYEVKIIIHNGFLELKVDGKYFCTYKNVLSLDKVNHIWIKSPTELKGVSVADGYIYEELANIF